MGAIALPVGTLYDFTTGREAWEESQGSQTRANKHHGNFESKLRPQIKTRRPKNPREPCPTGRSLPDARDNAVAIPEAAYAYSGHIKMAH
jgi:hypothetical protein